MTENIAKMHTDLVDLVQLINESQASEELGEAFASFMLNPTVVWAKFILTDDRKNANGQRIPSEEFDNLMRSGIHMPVKMAMGEIEQSHKNSKPLGVITHLKKITLPDGVSALMALAALWGEERPSDVTYIKDRFKNNEPVNVSWEILFGDSSFNNKANSMDLKDTVLKAATIVGDPAYEGRTQFLAVAARKWSKAYIDALPDAAFLHKDGDKRYLPVFDENGAVDRIKLGDALKDLGELNLPTHVLKEKKAIILRMIERFEAGASVDEISGEYNKDFKPKLEEGTLDELNEIKAKLQDVEAKLTTALEEITVKNAAIAEKETALAGKETELASLTERLTALETEIVPLKELKASLDAEAEKSAKLEALKTKFTDAGIVKDDTYFNENYDSLVALDDTSLNFMIQELKAFAEESGTSNSSVKKTKIPVLPHNDDGEISVKDMATYLRENRAKKK